jgi:hypothetical protein
MNKIKTTITAIALTVSAGTTASTICVVDNNTLPPEIQGQVHETIQSRGFDSQPIPSPALVEKFDCDAYMMYSGQMSWDFGRYLSEFRVTMYSAETHLQTGFGGKNNNEYSLMKWGKKRSKKLVSNAVNNSMVNMEVQ